jgi:HlyD family secretion protein
MDKIREQSKTGRWLSKPVLSISVALFASVFFAISGRTSIGKIQNIDASSLSLSRVTLGNFSHSLNVRGIVDPKNTVYLDSIAGGRVEEILVEQGAYVEQGQALVRLSNNSLQLDVISREAQISEQLNLLRNTQMMAETNRLNLSRELLDNDNQIQHLTRKLSKLVVLAQKNFYAKEQLDELKQDLNYYQQRRTLNLQRQKQEENIRTVQIEQLKNSSTMLLENLKFARLNLENLTIRAPISGYLSELTVSRGESRPIGSRLGQVDHPGQYKVIASMDEYYLNLVAIGMPVKVHFNGQLISTEITKIDSQVNDAQFTIEVDIPDTSFISKVSSNIHNAIKRGQSLDLEISLSEETKNTLYINRGAFLNSTGGRWAFILDKHSKVAKRRTIRLGRKNRQYVEVLEGLELGEQVITSSYQHFDLSDKLELNH